MNTGNSLLWNSGSRHRREEKTNHGDSSIIKKKTLH